MKKLIILLCSPLFLQAQDVPADSVNVLQGITLNAEAPGQEVVGSALILNTEIQRVNPTDLPAVLNKVPGVLVLSGAINTNRITIRGVGARTPFGTDKLRLYLDDIPVTNGTGVSTIEAFDPENLGGVRVIKGPAGTAWGANLGGAILLKTDNTFPSREKLSNRFTVGSFGLVKNNLDLALRDGKARISLAYNHTEVEGYRANSAFERDGLLLRANWDWSEKTTAGFIVNHLDYTAGIPSSLNRTDYLENPSKAADNWQAAEGFEANNYTLAGLRVAHRFNDQLRLRNSVYYSYLDHYEPRPFNILDEFTHTYGFRSFLEGKAMGGTFFLGGEFLRDEYRWKTFENRYREQPGKGSVQGDLLTNNTEFRRQFYAFASLNLPLSPSLELESGLSLNKTAYDYKGNTRVARDFDPILMPRVQLVYTYSENQELFAGVSRGFSNPGLEETLTPEGPINPDIRQETGTSYEVGGNWQFNAPKLQLGLTLYQMDIRNLLVAERVGEDQFLGKNAGRTRHRGIEATVGSYVPLGGGWQLVPSLNYTYNDHNFVSFLDGDDDFSGNPLTGVPDNRWSARVLLSYLSAFELEAGMDHVGAIPLRDEADLYSEAYDLVQLRMKYRYQISPALQLTLRAGIDNLMNVEYARSVLVNAVGFGGSQPRYYYPGNPRNYFAGVSITYSR